MDNIEVQYRFFLEDGSEEKILVAIDPDRLEMVNNRPPALPSWTMLGFHQCPHCPLEAGKHPVCPLAVNLSVLIKPSNRLLSYDTVGLEIVTRERTISQPQIKAELAISSLMGLIAATSACPHMSFFKPMARFHLPLATQEETIFRAVSSYLLGQYLRKRQGHEPDFSLKGLEDIYSNIKILNRAMAERLRAAAKTDAALNALVLLDIHAQMLPFALKGDLNRLDYLFTPFWMSRTIK